LFCLIEALIFHICFVALFCYNSSVLNSRMRRIWRWP
jgi:hypothetical protein